MTLSVHLKLMQYLRTFNSFKKMDQNEKLAKLRAGVSLAKAGAQQATIVTGEE